MQWPIEKGKNDKQWSKKKLHRRLKIEQHESHLKPGGKILSRCIMNGITYDK
jgi:hypothetical protein